ncbi:sensor histidine kinase [Sporanaerobacter sp. PP17-6a]|jgi:signal transduction histidine kinase|uniref:sensor histidine kinase n=1 Tax=Sporanaerobacter sp. PP17-6a TaxID=1891289 RepID=UPI00089FC10B|nr:HAMP domain-containing sensor histidine kinase [Sporanaerobacter sp. PP17-6a]MBE6081198.1 HAMP domain-containing histidine kinase [Tissierellaceae bacterium]SCL86565.1 Signal transduction histidine-protein kinase ArlS [Sporanaerobacter sp. PP17-6a]
MNNQKSSFEKIHGIILKIISTIKFIFNFVKLIIIVLLLILKFISNLIFKFTDKITNKLRFSIKFKLAFTYVFIFILISIITDVITLGVFNYYINNEKILNYSNFLFTILIFSNITGIIMVIMISVKNSEKLISPINNLTDMAKKISIDDLDKRIDVKGSKDELKELAITFNSMLDRIQESVERQNQFVSDASHELRTPIAVIQGYINLLDRWGKDDKAILNESIQAIKDESENMKHLIENLLFLARSDKHTQKIHKEKFMFNEIIDETVIETKMIDNSHIISMEKNEEFIINADRNLIKESLRIFIDNSIKYTPPKGTIKINSWKKNYTAIITIEDTGIGISKKDLPHIFNRFYRADKARNREKGGTGLGLPIAKWIIESHEGIINVTSEQDKGTKIKIELPL